MSVCMCMRVCVYAYIYIYMCVYKLDSASSNQQGLKCH